LVYGPLSDGVGRRFPLIVGLGITLIGSAMCYMASTMTMLIVGRFIQGFGAGAGASLWRTIFRDCFSGAELAKYGAYLSILIVFIVPAAPTLGGYLQEYFDWRASFFFLMIYSVATLTIVVLFFKETSVQHHKGRLTGQFYMESVGQLLRSPIFMGYSLCTFVCYGAFFSWFVVGPVLLIDIVGITPIAFGWITLLGGGISMAVAGVINGKMVTRYGTAFMLRLGWSLMIMAGMFMLLLHTVYGVTAITIVAPMLLFFFGATFIWPSVFSGAFAPFGKIAGYAGALYSFLQLGGAAVVGSIAAYLPDTNQVPLAIIFIMAPLLAWIVFEHVVVPREGGTVIG
jgi:DHA1 family bicyclomycin/chloramphenicol resistance-like MFS transporter/DHA1 family 2-module integral membrane pump EmrD-like MFS transporter